MPVGIPVRQNTHVEIFGRRSVQKEQVRANFVSHRTGIQLMHPLNGLERDPRRIGDAENRGVRAHAHGPV